MSWELQLKSFLNLQVWNHSLSLAAGSRNSLLLKRGEMQRMAKCIHLPRSQHRATRPRFWTTTLLSCPSIRENKLSSHGAVLGLLLGNMNTWAWAAEWRRKMPSSMHELCRSLWFSFPTPKLNLGAVSQAEPGHRVRAQNPQVADCLYVHECLTSVTKSKTIYCSWSYFCFIGASSSTYLLG